MDNGTAYLAIDGDNAGRLVGRSVLVDDVEALREISARIEAGQAVIQNWVDSHGGSKVSGGGDESTMIVPIDALNDVETLRNDYLYTTNLTITVGIGSSLSEAGKALLAGKLRGKNCVVHFDNNVQKELDQSHENVKSGNGTEEENKQDDHYLADQEANRGKTTDAQYHDQGVNPPIIQHNDMWADPKDSQGELMPQANKMKKDPTRDMEGANSKEDMVAVAQQVQDEAGEHDQPDPKESYGASPIDNPEAENGPELSDSTNQEGAGASPVDGLESENAPVTQEMEDNYSRPDNYGSNDPGDMGLEDDDGTVEDDDSGEIDELVGEPDITDVLKDGLDNHSDNINREKVKILIGQALAGFKQHQDILEKARDKAPELHDSCIAMLKAMIEMASMLGLGASAEMPEGEETPEDDSLRDDSGSPVPQETGDNNLEQPKAPDAEEDDSAPMSGVDDEEPAAPVQQQEQQAQKPQTSAPISKPTTVDDKKVGGGIGKLPKKNTTDHVAKTPMPENAVNGKGQQKVTDPKTGKTRWVDRKKGVVLSQTGVPVKSGGTHGASNN